MVVLSKEICQGIADLLEGCEGHLTIVHKGIAPPAAHYLPPEKNGVVLRNKRGQNFRHGCHQFKCRLHKSFVFAAADHLHRGLLTQNEIKRTDKD